MIVKMLNWEINQRYLEGIVVNTEYEAPTKQRIAAGTIVNVSAKNGILQVYCGNFVYELDYNRVRRDTLEQTLKFLQLLDVPKETVEVIRNTEPYKPSLGRETCSCLYLEIASEEIVSAYLHVWDDLTELEVKVDTSNFETTVTVEDAQHTVFFKCKPTFNGYEVYDCKGFTDIVVNNLSKRSVYLRRQPAGSKIPLNTGITRC